MINKKSFTEIYLKYFESLCSYACRFSNDKDESYEIVQNVMMNLLEKENSLPNINSIEKYLFRSVYNSCINNLEKKKVQNKYINYKKIRLLEIELENFEETFYQNELKNIIQSEIKKFTPKEKIVFEMRYVDGLKYKDIAEKLNISTRTVESHLQKTIKILREKFKKFI